MVDAAKPNHPVASHRVPPNRRQIIAQVIVSTVILISGIAIGGGGMVLALRDRIIPPVATQPTDGNTPTRDPNELGKRAEWIANRWKADYGLDDEQTRRAKETLATEFATNERLQEEFRKAEKTQREKFILAIKGILTTEQFTKWETDFRRMVEHMERFDPRRGGRGGPGGERRPEWRPDRRMDSNDRPGDWRGDRFQGPRGRRGDRPSEWRRDPNDPRGDRPLGRFMDPNAPRGDRPPDMMRGPDGPPGEFDPSN